MPSRAQPRVVECSRQACPTWKPTAKPSRFQLWPSESLIFLPGALDVRPGAKTAVPDRKITRPTLGNESERLNCFPDPPDSFPDARVSRMAARERIPGVGERSRASGFLGWPSGLQSGGSGSLDGRPGTKKAVR